MAFEKPVMKDPVPLGYAPSPVWYKVTDKDDWGTVAKKYKVDVKKLIQFNFKTNDTREVNWYLRRNVGCKVSRDGGRNWAFSDSASPGKIYIPVGNVTVEPEEITGDPGRRNKLAVILDDHEEDFEAGKGTETVLFVLDIFEVAHTVLEVASLGAAIGGSEALESLAEDTGLLLPIAFAVKFWTELGKANMAGLLIARRTEFLWGLSEGIILGANGAAPSYVSWNYWKRYPVYNSWYPDHGVELQQFHNLGIKTGYKYGKQLNLAEAGALFKDLHSRMSPSYESQYPSSKWSEWSDDTKKRYYDDCILIFKMAHLPR